MTLFVRLCRIYSDLTVLLEPCLQMWTTLDDVGDGKVERKKKRHRRGNKKKMRTKKLESTSGESSVVGVDVDVGDTEEADVWRWWNEGQREVSSGERWYILSHNGPRFPPPYKPLPKSVRFHYNNNPRELSLSAEETAVLYSKFLHHDCTKDAVFSDNFFNDWRCIMNEEEKQAITDFSKCDFSEISAHLVDQKECADDTSEDKAHRTCVMDGHVQSILNFIIEPPSLFFGRGDHPKRGRVCCPAMCY